jgi:hypothetical protein
MSLLFTRSGRPHIFNDVIDTTGRVHDIRGYTKWIHITATTNPCLIYFTEDDYTAGVNYLTVTTSAPFEAPLEIQKIWLKGSGGSSTVELIAAVRLN